MKISFSKITTFEQSYPLYLQLWMKQSWTIISFIPWSRFTSTRLGQTELVILIRQSIVTRLNRPINVLLWSFLPRTKVAICLNIPTRESSPSLSIIRPQHSCNLLDLTIHAAPLIGSRENWLCSLELWDRLRKAKVFKSPAPTSAAFFFPHSSIHFRYFSFLFASLVTRLIEAA